MKNETIEGIKITAVGELMLCLEGEGKPIYKFIYKKAAGVYWDENNHGFKSSPMEDWSCSKWFLHIASVVKSSLNVDLHISQNVTWDGLTEKDKKEIVESIN